MGNYALDYREWEEWEEADGSIEWEAGFYYIYNVGDDAPDESFHFTLQEEDEHTELVLKFIAALDGIVETGKDRRECSEIDCVLSAEEAAFDALPGGCNVSEELVIKHLKRLTVIANRTAQNLRGERSI